MRRITRMSLTLLVVAASFTSLLQPQPALANCSPQTPQDCIPALGGVPEGCGPHNPAACIPGDPVLGCDYGLQGVCQVAEDWGECALDVVRHEPGCPTEGVEGDTDYYALDREADGTYCKSYMFRIEERSLFYDPVPYYGQVVDGKPYCPSKDDGRGADCAGLLGRGGSGQSGDPDCSFGWRPNP